VKLIRERFSRASAALAKLNGWRRSRAEVRRRRHKTTLVSYKMSGAKT
jgi:hypothetical protein